MLSFTLSAVCALVTSAAALDSIDVQGNEFVNYRTKARLQIVGVDYQPGGAAGFIPGRGIDPLTDANVCRRDAALFQRLGINTIRIYNIEPSLNHDQCMSILNEAGIYLILDVNSPLPNGSLDRTAPWTTYNRQYLSRIFAMVEAFKDYPNVIGFFGGNEVINEQSAKQTPAYIRAVQRDLKEYISKHSARKIPVGYSAADVRPVLRDTWEYLTCDLESSPTSGSDFFGLNSYSWCGKSSYQQSGYDVLVDMFKDTTVPIFFSEYGCNLVQPRVFDEVQALYGKEMSRVFSGGLIYEFSQEPNNYGLAKLNDDGSATLLPDFANLEKQFSRLDIKALEANSSANAKAAPAKCNPNSIEDKAFLTEWDLPALPPGGRELIDEGLSGVRVGQLVKVKDNQVKLAVYDVNGAQVPSLSVSVKSTSNDPGPQNPNVTSIGKKRESGKDDKKAKESRKNEGARTRGAAMSVSCLLVVGVLVLLF